MNNDSTAINRNLRDLTGAIKEQNKRMREINSNLTQIIYILKELQADQSAYDNAMNEFLENPKTHTLDEVENYICSESKEREAEDEEEVNELIAHDLEGNEYVIRGTAIDVERPEKSYEEYFNRVHGRIVTEGMDCEDTEND